MYNSSGTRNQGTRLKQLCQRLSDLNVVEPSDNVTDNAGAAIIRRTQSAATRQNRPDNDLASRVTATGGSEFERKTLKNSFLYASMKMSSRLKKNQENGEAEIAEKHIEKIEHLLNELCDTEQKYIGTLNDVQMYLNYLEMTMVSKNPDVTNMEKFVDDIIKQHRDFHMDLNLINNNIQPVDSMGPLFLKYKSDLFDSYPDLTKYKVRLEQVACQHGVKELLMVKYKEFDDMLGFPSHLLTIVQRLPKYKLLLIRLEKFFKEKYKESNERLDEAMPKLQQAMKMLDDTIKLGEDYITIDSIKMTKDDLFQYGRIKLTGKFDSPTMKKVFLLLFENRIVIALIRGRNDSELIYACEIKVSQLGMNAFEADLLKLELTDHSRMHFDKPLHIQLIAENVSTKQQWSAELHRLLWNQATKIKETLSKKKGKLLLKQMADIS